MLWECCDDVRSNRSQGVLFADAGGRRRPHKVAICQHLDDLTEDGRNIGACNTVIIRKGPNGERQLVGHNTECVHERIEPEEALTGLTARSSVGVRESLLRADDSHVKSGKVRPGAVLGAGGACRLVLPYHLPRLSLTSRCPQRRRLRPRPMAQLFPHLRRQPRRCRSRAVYLGFQEERDGEVQPQAGACQDCGGGGEAGGAR